MEHRACTDRSEVKNWLDCESLLSERDICMICKIRQKERKGKNRAAAAADIFQFTRYTRETRKEKDEVHLGEEKEEVTYDIST